MLTENTLGSRTYAILLALAEGKRHGYDLMRQIALDSEGGLRIGPATLYTTLKRLLELGLILEIEDETNDPSGRRRYYSLSHKGHLALEEELARAEKFTSLLRRRLA